MDPFDIEKAKQGRQIVHEDGRKALRFMRFPEARDTGKIVFVFWDNGSWNNYYEDGRTFAEDANPDIGLAPERIVEYVAFVANSPSKESARGFYDGRNSIESAKNSPHIASDLAAVFKVSCNPDGTDPQIELVEEDES